jgi:uncharacterized protein (DUF488 family)
MNLYTFGYEGLALEAFIARLKKVGIRQIIDVRELPLSRKKGFSKSALSATLIANGIEYVSMTALGCPKPIRQRFKLDSDWRAYERNFCGYLTTQAKAVRLLARSAQEKTTCLLCFEADYNMCHRSLVARAALANGAPRLMHLTAETEIADVPRRAAA